MRTSKQAARDAKHLFRLCVLNGSLDEGRVHQAVQLVIQSNRRGYLVLLSHFQRLLKLDQDRRTATVESAIPLPEDLRDSVQSGLQRMYGPRTDVRFSHRPLLIGGMRIRVGSDVYDGSVRSELSALERSF